MAEPARQSPADPAIAERQRWLGALAKAPLSLLEEVWQALEPKPLYVQLRRPEIGLCMLRGRAGGTGMRFNLGEMTMTRAAVRLASGDTGFGYVAGRAARHAELAAVFDALLQDRAQRALLEQRLIAPAIAAEQTRREALAAKAAATKVEFFTLVRGEDPR
jgi:alpha-D-ribose 1-methylphosphonate 5-triphosphate synthase subunit PhnG